MVGYRNTGDLESLISGNRKLKMKFEDLFVEKPRGIPAFSNMNHNEQYEHLKALTRSVLVESPERSKKNYEKILDKINCEDCKLGDVMKLKLIGFLDYNHQCSMEGKKRKR